MRALYARLKAYFAHDVAIQRLQRLDDHLLADMGIPREDIARRVRMPAERAPATLPAATPAARAPSGGVRPLPGPILNPQNAC